MGPGDALPSRSVAAVAFGTSPGGTDRPSTGIQSYDHFIGSTAPTVAALTQPEVLVPHSTTLSTRREFRYDINGVPKNELGAVFLKTISAGSGAIYNMI